MLCYILVGVPDLSQVTTALKSNLLLDSNYETKVVQSISNKMHKLSERILGVRRIKYLSNWNSEGMVRECWKEDSPCGFSQMVEFENLFYIQRVFSIEAGYKNIRVMSD